MTAASINPKTVPTAEAIQEALDFLRNLVERKSTADDGGKTDRNSFVNSDIFKTIEAALKNSAESKENAGAGEDDSTEEEERVHGKRHAACAPVRHRHLDDEDEADDEGEEDEEDNPFEGDYYWCPGQEWKTIGLVAGGAALIGLGVLLCKMFDD